MVLLPPGGRGVAAVPAPARPPPDPDPPPPTRLPLGAPPNSARADRAPTKDSGARPAATGVDALCAPARGPVVLLPPGGEG
ncbi:hypothetical protein GCM10010347_56660 [Streptomyces cirratus]|uniref:Uncharacterized protein n=1 Tax=Streptomyces cirratus TaxID=68187 RepID=A0ABQ3F3T6_9ACTN|nr:hypothetical protein GCM10010347_56660 [Streptomyces cirratus]